MNGHKYKHKAGINPHPQPCVAPNMPNIVPRSGIPPKINAMITEMKPFQSNTLLKYVYIPKNCVIAKAQYAIKPKILINLQPSQNQAIVHR